ncbi:MAG: DUF4163 domain-containing protein [Saprospiraceae bacterium]
MSINAVVRLLLLAGLFWGYSCQQKQGAPAPITVNQNGEITLYGEKTALENLNLLLVDTLDKMPAIPDDLEIKYEGEVLMGMRAEIESAVSEAVAEAKALRKFARIEIQKFRKEKGTDCDQADEDRTNCAAIDFQYPVVQRGSDALKNSVEQWVNRYLSSILTGEAPKASAPASTLDAAAALFFKRHETYKGSAMYGAFAADCGSDVLLNDSKYLTLAISSYTFQGGAHGSATTAMATFDAQSGKQIRWDDLTSDKAALAKIAESEFRTKRAADFRKNGFEFDGTYRFKLPDNFGLIKSGIYLHFNPEEVSPYAMGSTTYLLPFTGIDHLVKIDWRNAVAAEPADSGASQDDPDLIAINDAIHGFYSWYDTFQKQDESIADCLREKDKHLTLDLPKLKAYFSKIKASGYISDVLINAEIAALKECEKHWKTQPLDEPPFCLDYDRFFCTQDWDLNFWTQAPIAAEGLGTTKATALMSSGEGDSLQEQKFDLQKENGKWLITKIYCE